MKYFIIETSTTEDIYGYSGGILPMDDAQIKALKELKARYDAIKKLDGDVGSVTYYNIPFSIDLLNDEFDGIPENGEFKEVSDEDYNIFTNFDGNAYKVDSPYIRISEFGLQVVWSSKWTSDEVWVSLSFEVLLNN